MGICGFRRTWWLRCKSGIANGIVIGATPSKRVAIYKVLNDGGWALTSGSAESGFMDDLLNSFVREACVSATGCLTGCL